MKASTPSKLLNIAAGARAIVEDWELTEGQWRHQLKINVKPQ